MRDFREHPNHVVLGIGLILIGAWLLLNDRFFTWPPGTQAIQIENSPVWGWSLVLLGFGILIWVYLGAYSIKGNRILLTIAAGVMAFLTGYEFLIWIATGMYESWLSNLILTAFVIVMARGSDTRHDSH